MTDQYAAREPSRADIDQLRGPLLLEFGAPWCGFCQAAQPLVRKALALHPTLEHLKIEDGRGRPLGRSFRVKLWPTLVFLQDGQEVGRLVRPADEAEIARELAKIAAALPPGEKSFRMNSGE